MDLRNEYGQPVDEVVAGWSERARPPLSPMHGRFCSVVPAAKEHAAQLYEAYAAAPDGRDWTYLPREQLSTPAAFGEWLEAMIGAADVMLHAIVDHHDRRAKGVAAFMRIDTINGVIEIGHVNFSPAMQRSALATEALVLMMRRVFDELGYRRLEWKCHSLNERSRAAALRLGFTFEGIFRQAMVTKGRNRDTAWFSIIDREWASLARAYEYWLRPENFSPAGTQCETLGQIIERERHASV